MRCCPGMLAWLALPLAACGGPAPTREWTPADHGQPEAPPADSLAQEPAEVEAAPQDNVARAARALWAASCASCHGRDGRGQGEGRPPGANVPDFTQATWQASRTDTQLTQTIHDGRGMMPAFGKQLNDSGIAALLQYIRGLGAAAAAPATVAPATDATGAGETEP